MDFDIDARIPYESYYLERIGKAKHSGDQLVGLCPFHEDKQDSFGVNLKDGRCICRAGCFRGNAITFHAKLLNITNAEALKDLARLYHFHLPNSEHATDPSKILPENILESFRQIPAELLDWMRDVRGWEPEIVERYEIGYNSKKKFTPGFIGAQRITIPVRDDLKNLVNIRSYNPKPGENEQKMMSWSAGSKKKGTWKGHGESRLFPMDQIGRARREGKIIYLVEGEPDCLCAISRGLCAVTNTAGAGTWKDEWNTRLKGLHVRIAYDNDQAGRTGENGQGGMLRVMAHLSSFAKRIECVAWPEYMAEKQDVTDFFVTHARTVADFEALPWMPAEEFLGKYGGAAVQGKSVEKDPEAAAIAELNERHAIITLGGKVLVMNETIDDTFNRPDITFSSVSDFKTLYANQRIWVQNGSGKSKRISKAERWIEHPERRQFRGLVFEPGGEVCDCYNLYKGLAISPEKGEWGRLRDHIFAVICSENIEWFQYLMGWMADAVQDPGGERPGVSIVLRGGKGTGKGVLFRTFGEIFGQHFLHVTDQSHLTGKFNQHQKNALVVFADECFFAGDKQAEAIIKRMITEPTFLVEPKGRDVFKVKNFIRLAIASNESWVIPAGIGERRFMALDVSEKHRHDKSYFEPIYAEINNGGKAAMLHDLLAFQYEKRDLRSAPKTDALLAQIEESMETECKFLYQILKEGVILKGHDDWREDFVQSDLLHAHYVEFGRALGKTYLASLDSFIRKLKKLCPVLRSGRQWINATRQRRSIAFGPLSACRKAFEDTLGQSVEWDEEPDCAR